MGNSKTTKPLRNGIVYKYNKYIQVNGSLFYAFELLCQIIENEIQNPFYTSPSKPEIQLPETKLYIQITKKYQPGYLGKLEELFKTKYPLWNRKVFSDRKQLEAAKENLTEIEYVQLLHKISIVNKAFNRIKLVTSIELASIKFDKVVFPSFNSYYTLIEMVQFQEAKVIQNRQASTIIWDDTFPLESIVNPKITFLHELPAQKLPLEGIVSEQYSPKLGFQFMVPKGLFKLYPKSEKIIAGKPITNINHNQNNQTTDDWLFQKPSLFAQVNNGSNNKYFLNTKLIEYHRNFLRWDENNRILPEARYYNIKVNIINDITKDSPSCTQANGIDNLKVTVQEPKLLSQDSSVTRFIDDLDKYQLKANDPLIKFLEPIKPE